MLIDIHSLYKNLRLGLLCLFSGLYVMAQESNSALFEGPTYADVHRTINKRHKFLGPYEFQKGSIRFDGQWIKNLDIKYDTYQDLLILKHPTAPGAPAIVVNTNRATAFRIGTQYFEYLSEDLKGVQGFFERLAVHSSAALYKKHRSKIQRKQASGLAYYEFKQAPYYVLLEGNTYRLVKKMAPEEVAAQKAKINSGI